MEHAIGSFKPARQSVDEIDDRVAWRRRRTRSQEAGSNEACGSGTVRIDQRWRIGGHTNACNHRRKLESDDMPERDRGSNVYDCRVGRETGSFNRNAIEPERQALRDKATVVVGSESPLDMSAVTGNDATRAYGRARRVANQQPQLTSLRLSEHWRTQRRDNDHRREQTLHGLAGIVAQGM